MISSMQILEGGGLQYERKRRGDGRGLGGRLMSENWSRVNNVDCETFGRNIAGCIRRCRGDRMVAKGEHIARVNSVVSLLEDDRVASVHNVCSSCGKHH